MKETGTTTDTIKIMIVDDHAIVRQGLAALMKTVPGFSVVAEGSDGEEAVALYRQHRPDVTLMDVRLPDMSGIDALLAIRAEFATARIIMLTTFEGDAEIRRAVSAGARGYILKTMPRKAIVEAIRKVYSGKTMIPPEVAEQLAEFMGDEPLSKRELDVLQRLAGGNRNIDIANLLFISEETVKGHVKHIMEKLRAKDRTEAVAIAVRRGIIQL